MDLFLNLCPEPTEYDLTTRLLGCVVPKVTVSTSPLECLHHLAEQTELRDGRRGNNQTEILVQPRPRCRGPGNPLSGSRTLRHC